MSSLNLKHDANVILCNAPAFIPSRRPSLDFARVPYYQWEIYWRAYGRTPATRWRLLGYLNFTTIRHEPFPGCATSNTYYRANKTKISLHLPLHWLARTTRFNFAVAIFTCHSMKNTETNIVGLAPSLPLSKTILLSRKIFFIYSWTFDAFGPLLGLLTDLSLLFTLHGHVLQRIWDFCTFW